MIHTGSCHCGKIRFEVDVPHTVELEKCNCSICTKSAYLHLILPIKNFKLLSGNDAIETYTFNSGVAQHRFCKTCGIKPFYIPRSNPDGIDVNVNCLDQLPQNMTIVDFDGKNWEHNAHTLAHKSKHT